MLIKISFKSLVHGLLPFMWKVDAPKDVILLYHEIMKIQHIQNLTNSADIQKMNDTYLTILNSYGDIVELDYQFDVQSIIEELKSIDNWIDGSNNKKGLTIGSVNDLELTKRNDSSINDNLKSVHHS